MLESNKIFQVRSVDTLRPDDVESLEIYLRAFSGREFSMLLKTGKLFSSELPDLDHYLFYKLPEGFYKGKRPVCGLLRLRHFERYLKYRDREFNYGVDSVRLADSESIIELEKLIAEQGPHIAFGIMWAKKSIEHALQYKYYVDHREASESIALRITALRKERGLTQVELAKKIGKSTAALAKWEKGRKHDSQYISEDGDENLNRLAEVLETTVEYLKGS